MRLKEFTRLLNDIFYKTSKEDKDMVLYTGYMGMIQFDLVMLGMYISIPKWSYSRLGKYAKYDAVIHIGSIKYVYKSGVVKEFVNRHSNIKIYIDRRNHKFDIYNGTKFMFSAKKLNSEVFDKLKPLL